MGMTNKEALAFAGICYDEGVARFSGRADLYEKYLRKFPSDTEFSHLSAAMNRGDYEAAFRSAHTIKGMVGNLSITDLYHMITPFVEMLRGQADIPRALEAFPAICETYQRTLKGVTDYFA